VLIITTSMALAYTLKTTCNNTTSSIHYLKCLTQDPNNGLERAAKDGDVDLIEFFIAKGANAWQRGMYGAAVGGHKDLVDFFIDTSWSEHTSMHQVWEYGMWHAALGGHKDLVDFFIDKEVTRILFFFSLARVLRTGI